MKLEINIRTKIGNIHKYMEIKQYCPEQPMDPGGKKGENKKKKKS